MRLKKTKGDTYPAMFEMFSAWQKEAEKKRNDEITQKDYDKWRYNYPKLDTTGRWVKVPSEELSDYLVKELGKK
jgi:hypothetical protein